MGDTSGAKTQDALGFPEGIPIDKGQAASVRAGEGPMAQVKETKQSLQRPFSTRKTMGHKNGGQPAPMRAR